jgi:hypothetical protein
LDVKKAGLAAAASAAVRQSKEDMGANKSIRGWSLTLLLIAASSSGCRTTSEDIQHWANTKQGPHKLASVIAADKYSTALRAEAVHTLIGMPRRNGRLVGIEQALASLQALDADTRAAVVAHLVPALMTELTQPASAGTEKADPSVQFKDAAYALLTETDPQLIANEEQQSALKGALSEWAMTDFEKRLDAPGQSVGMEQLLKLLGPRSVEGLPKRIKPDAKIARIVSLVADIGSKETRAEAARQLVEIAKFTESPAWLKQKEPELKQANEVSGIKTDDKRFQSQLDRFQEEELLRHFAALKRLAAEPGAHYLAAYAGDPKHAEKRRRGALAALDGQVGLDDQALFDSLLQIAKSSEAPDGVRTLAFRRLDAYPYSKLAPAYFALFEGDDWRVRWMAGESLLKKIEAGQLEQFMTHLGKVEHMSVTEPLTYGKLLPSIKGMKNVSDVVDSYSSSSNDTPVRLTALGYYYSHGTTKELDKVSRYERDREKVPDCSENAKNCEWTCGGTEVETVGDFVKHCIVPAMKERASGPTGNADAKGGAKASQDAQKTQ